MARNPLKMDPTRTTTLRRRFMADTRGRFAALERAVWRHVVEEDCFGLNPVSHDPFKTNAGEYQFLTDDKKAKAFQDWFEKQLEAGVLSVDSEGKPWTAEYVESAYKQGLMRAYGDVHAESLASSQKGYAGSKKQFLADSFAQPADLNRVKLLSMRTFENMKGVTATAKQRMGMILAGGLAHGDGPRQLATQLKDSIGSLTSSRALTIARTEIIHSYAEGQLDAFEKLGVEELGVEVEWMTAGDDAVCPDCADLEGEVFTVGEARGMLPLHPNCRCAWVPAPDYKRGKPKGKPATREEASKGSEGPLPEWGDNSTTSIIRWMGNQGWSVGEAKNVLGQMNIESSINTIRRQISEGRKGVLQLAKLTQEQIDRLAAMRAGGVPIPVSPTIIPEVPVTIPDVYLPKRELAYYGKAKGGVSKSIHQFITDWQDSPTVLPSKDVIEELGRYVPAEDVTLYRGGMATTKAPISSWTYEREVAEGFVEKGEQVLTRGVSPKDILLDMTRLPAEYLKDMELQGMGTALKEVLVANGEFAKQMQALRQAIPVVPSFAEHSSTSVIRWMGKEGFSFQEAKAAAQASNIKVADATIRTQLQAGKAGKGAIPLLKDQQSTHLQKFRGKATVPKEPVPKTAPIMPAKDVVPTVHPVGSYEEMADNVLSHLIAHSELNSEQEVCVVGKMVQEYVSTSVLSRLRAGERLSIINALQAEYIRTIEKLREFGNVVLKPIASKGAKYPLASIGNAKLVKDVQEAAKHFPTEWLKDYKSKAKLTVGYRDRGWFNMNGVGGGGRHDLLLTDGTKATATHELGHAMEKQGGRNKLQKEFLLRRAKETDPSMTPVKMYTNANGVDEFNHPDKFKCPYMGREYGDERNEIFSTGVEALYHRPDWIVTDDDFMHFIVGLLVGHGRDAADLMKRLEVLRAVK